MRNTLSELPVLFACLWSGAAAGFAVRTARLPKGLWLRKNRGRRAGFFRGLLFALCDLIACFSAAALFFAVLVMANGGEVRLYAVCGFFCGLAAVLKLTGVLIGL